MPILNLPEVTTITVDDRSDGEATAQLAAITRWHRSLMKVGREVILSGARPDVDGIDWIKLEKWKADYRSCYSLWCQKEMLNHFSTPFVMVWQLDGFAVNPQNWNQEFTEYDFVGSPFSSLRNTVGNGGFSLRSRLFCEKASRLPDCGEVPEDVYFCICKRLDLQNKGVRFCPLSVANKWGFDLGTEEHSLSGRFGFHGKLILPVVCQHMASSLLISGARHFRESPSAVTIGPKCQV